MADYKRTDEIRKELKLKDTKIYSDYFEDIIMKRGEKYFIEDRVRDITQDENTYYAIVSGTNDYKVSVEFDNDELKNMSCECEYYKSGKNCKHIFALIYALKFKNNFFLIYDYNDELYKKYKNKYKTYSKELNRNINNYSDFDKDVYVESFKKRHQFQIDRLNKVLGYNSNEFAKLVNAMNLEELIEHIDEDYKEVKKQEKVEEKIPYKKEKRPSILGGLIGIILGISTEPKEEKEDKWVFDELEKGNYEPYEMKYNGLDDLMEPFDDDHKDE